MKKKKRSVITRLRETLFRKQSKKKQTQRTQRKSKSSKPSRLSKKQSSPRKRASKRSIATPKKQRRQSRASKKKSSAKKPKVPASIRLAKGPVKKQSPNKNARLEKKTVKTSQRTPTIKRYSASWHNEDGTYGNTISFKRRTVEYADPVSKDSKRINRFFREQVRGVDATNFYREYGHPGEAQKFRAVAKILVTLEDGTKVEKWKTVLARTKVRSEKEFLDALKNRYSGWANPASKLSQYAKQEDWDDYEIEEMIFEVVI